MNNKNNEFLQITSDILTNEEFLELKKTIHHGMNRYDHSYRVAITSYVITKFLRLDYIKTARAALLHDFFLESNQDVDISTRLKTLINHPSYAVKNSNKYFELSELEEDIISTHMFPIGKRVPKYLESWIVDLVDDGVAVYEKIYGIQTKMSFATSFLFLLFMNRFK